MKIKYINEGYFKKPEQMKAGKVKSAAERLASNASKVFLPKVEPLINSYFDVKSFLSVSSIREDLLSNAKYYLTSVVAEMIASHFGDFGSFTTGKLKFLLFNVKLSIENDNLMCDIYPIYNDYAYGNMSFYSFHIDANKVHRGVFPGVPAILRKYNVKTCEEAIGPILKDCVKGDLEYCEREDSKESEEKKNLLNYILNFENIEFNKIHMFSDIANDIYLTSNELPEMTDETINEEFLNFSESFSIENKGKCTFKILSKNKTYYTTKLLSFDKILGKGFSEKLVKRFISDADINNSNASNVIVSPSSAAAYSKSFKSNIKTFIEYLNSRHLSDILDNLTASCVFYLSAFEFEITNSSIKKIDNSGDLVYISIMYKVIKVNEYFTGGKILFNMCIDRQGNKQYKPSTDYEYLISCSIDNILDFFYDITSDDELKKIIDTMPIFGTKGMQISYAPNNSFFNELKEFHDSALKLTADFGEQEKTYSFSK